MRIKRVLASLVAAAALSLMPPAAGAATIVYKVSALFEGLIGTTYFVKNGTLTGIGDTGALSAGTGFSRVGLTSLQAVLGDRIYDLQGSFFAEAFPTANVFVLGNLAVTGSGLSGYDAVAPLAPTSISAISRPTYSTSAGTLSLAGYSGTFEANVDGAVPEPATWAMMLTGFAAVGLGLRAPGKRRLRVRIAHGPAKRSAIGMQANRTASRGA